MAQPEKKKSKEKKGLGQVMKPLVPSVSVVVKWGSDRATIRLGQEFQKMNHVYAKPCAWLTANKWHLLVFINDRSKRLRHT